MAWTPLSDHRPVPRGNQRNRGNSRWFCAAGLRSYSIRDLDRSPGLFRLAKFAFERARGLARKFSGGNAPAKNKGVPRGTPNLRVQLLRSGGGALRCFSKERFQLRIQNLATLLCKIH